MIERLALPIAYALDQARWLINSNYRIFGLMNLGPVQPSLVSLGRLKARGVYEKARRRAPAYRAFLGEQRADRQSEAGEHATPLRHAISLLDLRVSAVHQAVCGDDHDRSGPVRSSRDRRRGRPLGGLEIEPSKGFQDGALIVRRV
jgi:hypothetical protein